MISVELNRLIDAFAKNPHEITMNISVLNALSECLFLFHFSVAPTGDHVISLIDEISYLSPPAPLLSQYDDINPEQFCNGDNRPADCGTNCMCTHKIDIPLNAVVEIVLVDEGNGSNQIRKKSNRVSLIEN